MVGVVVFSQAAGQAAGAIGATRDLILSVWPIRILPSAMASMTTSARVTRVSILALPRMVWCSKPSTWSRRLKPFFAYMLRCADGSYYLGHTDELEKRVAEHQHGEGCAWTKSRLPVDLVWCQEFPDRDAAREAEQQIKRWSRAKKEALIAGDYDRPRLLSGRSRLSRAVAFTFGHPLCVFCTPSSKLDSVHKRPRGLEMTSAASPTRDLPPLG